MTQRLRVGLVLAALLAVLSAGSVARAHTQAFTFERNATLSPGGTLITVRGTFTCSAFHIFSLRVTVFQGDEQASGGISGTCTGGNQPWQVTASSFRGPFHGGRAVAAANLFTSGFDGFETFQADAVVHLR